MKKQDKEIQIITLLRIHVAACNTRLKRTVSDMPLILLLRNCFPIDRPYFVIRLKKEGLLFNDQAAEFLNKNSLS